MRREAVRLGLELLTLLSKLQKQGYFSLFSMNDSHVVIQRERFDFTD
jgi:hypothetical protein